MTHEVGPPEYAFQAALAQYHGLTLATRNPRDFPPDRHPLRGGPLLPLTAPSPPAGGEGCGPTLANKRVGRKEGDP